MEPLELWEGQGSGRKTAPRGIETTVRLSNGYSLLNLCERATLTELSGGLQPPDAIRVLFLAQQRAKLPAVEPAAVPATDVFCGRQVTDLDGFLRFFLCHFILLSRWLAFRELSSWELISGRSLR
jgi:hypothetical protein